MANSSIGFFLALYNYSIIILVVIRFYQAKRAIEKKFNWNALKRIEIYELLRFLALKFTYPVDLVFETVGLP